MSLLARLGHVLDRWMPAPSSPEVTAHEVAIPLQTRHEAVFVRADFRISTVRASSSRRPWNGKAANAVRKFAYDLSADAVGSVTVTQLIIAQNEINMRLENGNDVAGTPLRAISGSVSLSIDPLSRKEGLELERLARQAEVKKAELQNELVELEYLRDHVLDDPRMAQLYWLQKNSGPIGDLSGAEFDHAMRVLYGQSQSDVIADLVRDFLAGIDQRRKEQLLDQLSEIFVHHERGELADRLRAVEGGRLSLRRRIYPVSHESGGRTSGEPG